MAGLRVVVGVDGSPEAREAIRWTSRLMGALGGEVVVVHALGLLERLDGTLVVAHRERAEIERLAAGEWCGDLGRDGTPVRSVVKDGHPVDVLLGVAADVDAHLIVVGSRGSGSAPDLALGSTSLHLLRATQVPVLVLPDRLNSASHLSMRRILVAVDQSRSAHAAVEVSCGLAAAFGAWVTAVQAVDDLAASVEESVEPEMRDRVDNCGVPAHIAVRRGEADEVVRTVAMAIDADLVVTGCRPCGRDTELLAGSVSRQVALAVHRPMLVVPGDQPVAPLGGSDRAPLVAS